MPSFSTTGSRRNTGTDKVRRLLVHAVKGMVVGGVFGFLVARFAPGLRLPALSGADVASLLIAFLLFSAGAYTIWASANPDRFARILEHAADGEPGDPLAARTGRQSGIVSILAGIMLAIPPLMAASPLTEPLRIATFGVITALLLLESWVNWHIWRDGDELTRSVIVAAGAVSFWIGQIALFLWATSTRLGLMAEVDAWTILTVLMGLYLLVSIVVSARRGFGEFA